jgi:hypothetical protein
MKKIFLVCVFFLSHILNREVSAQTSLPLGEQLLDRSVAGKNCVVTIALQQTLDSGGMNTVGLTTNRSFTSFVEYQDFIAKNSLRLRSFLPNQGEVRFKVWTDFADPADESFYVDRDLGLTEKLTVESFKVQPARATLALQGVVSAKFKQDESGSYKPLITKDGGVVFDSFFFTNQGRLRIVLSREDGTDAVFTQGGTRIEVPTVTIYRVMWEGRYDYDETYLDDFVPREYSIVVVNGSYGADTVLESSEDFVKWERIGQITWEQYPVLMIEVDHRNQNKFFRAWSY